MVVNGSPLKTAVNGARPLADLGLVERRLTVLTLLLLTAVRDSEATRCRVVIP